MYDPFAQPPAPGTVQTMTAPAATPSGVMPLSPNNALAPTVASAMRDRFGGNMGEHMRPGGMMSGGPMQSPGVQAIRSQQPDHNAFQLAMRNAPDDAARLQIQAAFQSQMDQWHSNVRTALGQYHQQQQDWRAGGSVSPMPPTPLPVDPVMTPGGGGTGAPPQGPTGQFPLNPGAPPTNDWRTMRTPKPSYGI